MPESRTPYTTSNNWDAIRNRLEQVARQAGGTCGITISILAIEGQPVQWSAPEITKWEPRNRSRELLVFLTQASGLVVQVDDEGRPIQGE